MAEYNAHSLSYKKNETILLVRVGIEPAHAVGSN